MSWPFINTSEPPEPPTPEAVVEAAQAAISAHSAGTPTGKCAACGEREPCRTRNTAHATLAAFGILPRRTPSRAGAHWQHGCPRDPEGVPQCP